jgi:uncharacterized membrane protein (UPF0127 family)
MKKEKVESQNSSDELEHAQTTSFVNIAETNESRARGLARRLFMKKIDNVGLHLSASEADLVTMYSECERIANIIVNVILLEEIID